MRSVERALRDNGFSFVTADPTALWVHRRAYDGAALVVEADVGGKYRYVARDPGQWNEDMLWRMAGALQHLADLRTPGSPRILPC